MSGKGVLTYKNGCIYDGCWSKNKVHGEGKMYYSNGDEFDGFW